MERAVALYSGDQFAHEVLPDRFFFPAPSNNWREAGEVSDALWR